MSLQGHVNIMWWAVLICNSFVLPVFGLSWMNCNFKPPGPTSVGGSFFSSSLLAWVLPCVGLPSHWIPVTCLPNPCELLTHVCVTTYLHATGLSPNYLPPVTHLLPSWPPPPLIELLYHCWVVCLGAPWHWHNHKLTPLPRIGPQCSCLWLLLSSSWLSSLLLCIPLHAKL